MKTYTDKTQENKSQLVDHSASQKQSSEKSTLPIIDNRPEAIVQKKLQDRANNNPKSKKAAHLQAMIDRFTLQKKTSRIKPISRTNQVDISGGIIQRTGIMAMLTTGFTGLLYFLGAGTLFTSIAGLFAAYFLLRQGYESALYRYGLTKNKKRKLLSSKFQVHLRRTQRYNMKSNSYQDDHISINLIMDSDSVTKVGFWMPKDDYIDMIDLAIWKKGEIRDDSKKFMPKMDMSGDLKINITPEEAKALHQKIEKAKENPPRFSSVGYLGYTCSSWAWNVLNDCGITVPQEFRLLRTTPDSIIPDKKMHNKEV